jgi:prepilin-type N-terminal cleavage/methylation domain-containing protein/prepilin-type processing-associated H-X9-DG protein
MTITGKPRAGFTLIELLTVIAIIGILASILIPVVGQVRASAHRAQCSSNMRQLGTALRLFADDHNGWLPGTAHINPEESWIFSLRPYLDDVDDVRICPADPRADEMRRIDYATSYLMNDLVFFAAQDELGQPVGDDFRRLDRLRTPSQTKLAFIGSDSRGLAVTEDHTHASSWANNWAAVINDIAPDRHHAGSRSSDRTQGTSNYLYADGHVETIPAAEVRRQIESGVNIALPPEARPR